MALTFRGGVAFSVTLGNGGLESLMNINEQVSSMIPRQPTPAYLPLGLDKIQNFVHEICQLRALNYSKVDKFGYNEHFLLNLFTCCKQGPSEEDLFS